MVTALTAFSDILNLFTTLLPHSAPHRDTLIHYEAPTVNKFWGRSYSEVIHNLRGIVDKLRVKKVSKQPSFFCLLLLIRDLQRTDFPQKFRREQKRPHLFGIGAKIKVDSPIHFLKFFCNSGRVAQVSPAISPNSIRQTVNRSRVLDSCTVSGLEIRDTSGWKPALRVWVRRFPTKA
jgi:hypothetical protein